MNDKNNYRNGKDLQLRTKRFAIQIVTLAKDLEKDPITKMVGRQIFRSGTSVAANYRAACRAKSSKDFINKLSIVVEEADETLFWLELLTETNLIKPEMIESLLKEANEITSIMVSSKNTALYNQKTK